MCGTSSGAKCSFQLGVMQPLFGGRKNPVAPDDHDGICDVKNVFWDEG